MVCNNIIFADINRNGIDRLRLVSRDSQTMPYQYAFMFLLFGQSGSFISLVVCPLGHLPLIYIYMCKFAQCVFGCVRH